ncbi:glycosyltransferase [Opitutus sp. ER46]|uniref:glycosyltransferase n=1 Tax=Opitutus sp. ER46 TaxID=2161864 RepID=UPI000D306772|nr:glycosyltransferase [Opitutus sp. ER46]PTX95627.1 hypothetical protein DB354_09430 [Opitutus sp. ER46]
MSAPTHRVVHVAPWVTTGGGIETLLRWHRRVDVAQQLAAWQLALFDRVPDAPDAHRGSLRADWRHPLFIIRRRFSAAMSGHRGATVVYHNAWGLPLLADGDESARRVAYLHGGPTFVAPFLPRLRGWVDGVVVTTPAVRSAVARALPELAPERVLGVCAPVEPSPLAPRQPATTPWTIGYAGRLERSEKRADRLPAFVEALAKAGVAARCEVLGDGRLRPALERALGGRVVFHGWRTGEDYWRVLSRWDAMVFFSETEGMPLALVEGLAAGVIPFFPAIGGSLGDVYAPLIDARCHYPPGDLRALAQRIGELSREPAGAIATCRDRGRALATAHQPERYGADFAGFLRRLADLPRVSRSDQPRRQPRLADVLPLGVVTRVCPGALWR